MALGEFPLMACVASSRPELALRFYRDTLGLTFVADEPGSLVFRSAGILLRVQKVEVVHPTSYTVAGWDVPDLAAAVLALAARGVRFETFSWVPQDNRGIWVAPDGSKVAWFKDPDGNLLSLSEFPHRSDGRPTATR